MADFYRTPEEHHFYFQALRLSSAFVDNNLGMLYTVNAFLGIERDDKVIVLGRNVINVVVRDKLEFGDCGFLSFSFSCQHGRKPFRRTMQSIWIR